MTIAIITTIASWVLLFLFEVLKVNAKKTGKQDKNPFFVIGTALLIIAWFYILATNFNTGEILGISAKTRGIAGGALTIIFIGFYVYAVCASFPKGTLNSNEKGSAVSTGVYAYCRHPGFYAFWAVAIGSTLCVGSKAALAIGFGNAAVNTVYIILQDIYFFPSYIEGYDEYKKNVSFFGNLKKA